MSSIKTFLSPQEFADKLEFIGNKFIELNNFTENRVEFDIGEVYGTQSCGMTACHGGWLSTFLPAPVIINPYLAKIFDGTLSEYVVGKARIAAFLGFIDSKQYPRRHVENLWKHKFHHFNSWAAENPNLWGNPYGLYMTDGESGPVAFDSTHAQCTLEVIGKHYLGVAARVRALGDSWETSNANSEILGGSENTV